MVQVPVQKKYFKTSALEDNRIKHFSGQFHLIQTTIFRKDCEKSFQVIFLKESLHMQKQV